MQKIDEKYAKQLAKRNEINKALEENKIKQESIKATIDETIKKLEQAKNVSNIKDNFENIGSAIKDTTKKIAKWTLAVFGVRAVYGFIRKLTSTYLSQNENLTKKIEGMWTGLAQILGPVIEKIINFIHKLVTAVLYFASVLTGTNYVQKANAQILKNQKKQTDALTKSNNKLTASFDEMNVLNDSSSGSGTTGTNAELFDISELGENIKTTIETIAKAFKPLYEKLKDIIDWAKKNPDIVAKILGGVALLTLISKIIGGSGAGLLGIKGLLLELLAIGIITISIIITEEWKKTTKALEETSELVEEVNENEKTLTNQIVKGTNAQKKNSKEIAQTVDRLKQQSKRTSESAKEQAKLNTELLSGSSLGLASRTATAQYTGALEKNAEATMESLRANELNIVAWGELYRQGKLNRQQTIDYKNALKDYIEAMELANDDVKTHAIYHDELSQMLLIAKNQMEKLDNETQDFNNSIEITNKDLQILDKTIDTETKKKLKEFGVSIDKDGTLKVNDLSKAIKNLPSIKKILLEVSANDKGAKEVINKFIANAEKAIRKMPGMSNINLPRLARGGIVNNPGAGVNMGSYIAGERGPEAVLPLDDNTMDRLGEAIARHMNITANITNSMNGRVIARELQKVIDESNFAFNS